MTAPELRTAVIAATERYGVTDLDIEDKGQGQYVFRLRFAWHVLPFFTFRDLAYTRAVEFIEEHKDKGMMVLVAVR